ncbi:hypothetical protein SAMN05216302_101378 [Nitrosomonas aestuarii]|uniref:Uncharacterized protein n=1 Tax=Nitrosomonas aestuarii TaxID=52441 RepID=A0A1I4BV39_9PROT|nr:hypothetical protein [Nitrosomonas aestuarii]SFK72525.1 hypothetical protein SAMN05216302_101378 [Nitrosomonas aestuarii]
MAIFSGALQIARVLTCVLAIKSVVRTFPVEDLRNCAFQIRHEAEFSNLPVSPEKGLL